MKNIILDENSLLTFADLSKIVKVSIRTLYRWIDSEIIPPPIKLGGSLRWKKEDIKKWLDSQ